MLRRRRKRPIIHHNDIHTAARTLTCGVKPRGGAEGLPSNWTFEPNRVTCQRCTKILKGK